MHPSQGGCIHPSTAECDRPIQVVYVCNIVITLNMSVFHHGMRHKRHRYILAW
jgi:hypothetical protein